MMETVWTVYLLECADGSLYTGITRQLDRRLRAHAKGTAAKYTRGRGPFTVRHTEQYASRSEALQREACIKQLSRARKLRLARYAGAL